VPWRRESSLQERGCGCGLGCGLLFFDHARRRHDRGDREVAAADQRLDAFRQRDRGNVDRAMNVQTRQVYRDEIGNGVGGAQHVKLVADDVEHAAALKSRRLAMIEKAHRNGQTHFGAGGKAQEVDMHGLVGHRIDLEPLGNHARLLAVDLEHEQGGEKRSGIDVPLQGAVFDGDILRSRIAAIDHARHEALLAHLECGTLAGAGARLGAQLLCLTHGKNSLDFPALDEVRGAKAALLADGAWPCNRAAGGTVGRQ